VFFFVLNSTGLLDVHLDSFPGFDLKTDLLLSATGEIKLPPVFRSAEFILMLVSGIILSFALPILKPIAASLLIFLFSIPPTTLGVIYPFRETAIPMQYSLLVILVLFGMNVLLNYFTETQKKQKLLDMFGQYVPPEIVTELSMQSENINLDGESKYMTVLFCDLHNFSGISEQLTPKELVKMLNDYFNDLTQILYKHGATIDKYIGDSIMTFWSAPVTQEDHARRAVLASFEMQEAVKKLSDSYVQKGWPSQIMGIGINSGMMNVGNMGSRYRLAYTVIGDAVNLSSRLQNMTRIYHVNTICGEETAMAVSDIEFIELDTVTVRGKKIISKIFHPLGFKSEVSEHMKKILEQHKHALNCYYEKNFTEADDLFCRLIQQNTGFEDYYRYMLHQVAEKKNITTVMQGEIS
jgi:adenylate cyclase